jgi:hypothetical protein
MIAVLSSEMTRADEPRQLVSWSSLGTARMQIESYSSAQGEVISSYIPYFQDIGRLFWSWDPKKQPKNASGDILLERGFSVNEMMKNLFVEFNLHDTAHFRKVWFKPTAEIQFRGLLGIHDFEKKRPLIILRMGIHGNVDEMIAERFLAKLIYEELDANFLVLESLTSHAFLSKNKNISFGGVDEGLQTFVAMHELVRSELKHVVSSMHLVALSMGSHGSFVTALLDQSNGQKIKSVVNFCPLINLQENMEFHAGNGFANVLVDAWNVRRLRAIFEIYQNEPGITGWWKSIFDLKPRFTPSLISILNRDRKEPLLKVSDVNSLVPEMKWPRGFEAHLQNSKSFFELNNYWSLYQGVKTPVMIYTTPKDPLVINQLNAERIFDGRQPGDFSSLKYKRLDHGVHCGLPAVYRWEYIAKLLREGLQLP